MTVKNGRKVSLRYKASDAAPTCGKATVTLRFSKGRALKKTVAALLSSVRSGDLVGRFGGDEFIVVLTGVRGIADAERVASAILVAAATPYSSAGVRFTPSLSVGLTMVQPGQVLDAVIRDADEALYAAKSAGRNRIVSYGPEILDD